MTAATVRAAVAMPSFGGVKLTLCCLLLSLPNSQEKSGRLENLPKSKFDFLWTFSPTIKAGISRDSAFVRVKQGGKEMSLHRWSNNRVLPTLQIQLSAANTAAASLG